ncbi:MAG TPA: hypothetical protein VHU19_04015 [Pyrinomonadaceae bacterium]|jgi:hypothetical protein|nr:hypothetical protein [Pyrinomonadaceae bacterium]
MKRHGTQRSSSRVIFAALALALAATLLASTAEMQAGKKPITRKGLVEAVKINGLSTPEMIQFIQRRGVDFEMTADAEQELQQVGARPEVIEAARSNYRAPEAAATAPAARPAYTPPPRNSTGQPVPSGPPLSRNEIVTMLQGGIPSARVEQFVEARGVTFALNPETTSEIKSAGGDRSLIGAITEKGPAQTADNSTTSSPFGNAGAQPAAANNNNAPDYDDYIDRASSAISSQDWNSAMNYAQQAARLDPTQPRAFTLLGTMLLYARQDINSAEQAMRAAIERGGTAAFHVYHDHDGAFGHYCEGSFFITKTGVSYKANDGRDTFETDDSNIKEAKINLFTGAQVGAFHIKPVQKINGRDNFNFAPLTKSKAESELIIRLIKAY